MDDLPLQKIAISGPTLASLLQRVSSSPADVDGLFFGHISHVAPSTLSDDSSAAAAVAATSESTLIATVTSFLCPGTPLSFFDSLGRLNHHHLSILAYANRNENIIGWFSSRRRSRLLPSMREFNVSASLAADLRLSLPIENSADGLTPRVFALFSTPPLDTAIHTHEYRAFQFRTATESFEPRSVDVVNLGPGFRSHYGNFRPNSSFPWLACDARGLSRMHLDRREETLSGRRQAAEGQLELDSITEGFTVASLSRLMGPEAISYTSGLEEMYEKMLMKVDSLARVVEMSSAKVLEMEHYNSKLRADIAGIKRVADGYE